MKAAIWTAYGPPEVLSVREVATAEPGAGEVLIKVEAATVTAGDAELRSHRFAESGEKIGSIVVRVG